MLILVLAPPVLIGWNGKISRTAKRSFKPPRLFTFLVCIVDYGWAIILVKWGVLRRPEFLLFPTYYIYNALIFLLARSVPAFRRVFLRLTLTWCSDRDHAGAGLVRYPQ